MAIQTPNTKVTAGALAGALTVVLLFLIQTLADVEITAEVGSAVTVILTFFTSYLVPESSS